MDLKIKQIDPPQGKVTQETEDTYILSAVIPAGDTFEFRSPEKGRARLTFCHHDAPNVIVAYKYDDGKVVVQVKNIGMKEMDFRGLMRLYPGTIEAPVFSALPLPFSKT